ncbi:MAG: PQQ-binding-like beta-propeller repeat protein, partial [Bacteroidales bacterium]|nr:PQQ-binding-like beta-propeller repeat protein [Bacteroidales bacterium]
MTGLLNHHLAAQDCWPSFRGDAQYTGRSEAAIPRNPSLLWTFKTSDAVKAAPVVCNGVIVVGSADGNVYGITLDGKLKWKINTGSGVEAPALIQNEIAYVGNYEGKVFAIEVSSGRTLWTYATEGQIIGAANYWEPEGAGRGSGRTGNAGKSGSANGGSRGSVEGGVIVVGSYDYYLHGIDAATGEGLWKYEADNFLNGAPAIVDGVAVFGGCDGLLHQVRVKDGALVSRKEVASYIAGSVAADQGVTYVGDYDGKFTCMELSSGREVWSFKDEATDLPFIAAPSLSKDKVYIGSRDKYVYCFDKKDGKLQWKVNTGGRVDASPVLVREKLIVATLRGDLLIMDSSDGRTLWSYELGSAITGNPAVIDGYIIAGADDGRIYCFGEK